MKEQIIICMPAKNAAATIEKSILSFINQDSTNRDSILLIGNDQSTDETVSIIQRFLPNPRIQLLEVNCGAAYLNRNYLNNYARKNFSKCILIGRLDADDILYNKSVLKDIETLYDTYNFDVLLGSNKQSRQGVILESSNIATLQLLDVNYLLNRLKNMSNQIHSAELPSCNLFIKPEICMEYPSQLSAEDHWFLVDILLKKNELNIHIAPSLIYCIYSLNGAATNQNQIDQHYTQSRINLYNYFKNKI